MTSPSRTVSFHTFGCKVNQYETEELREQLALGGYRVVPSQEASDVAIVNSCSVTADADSSCRQLVRKLLRERPATRLVVTGCYAERAPDELRALSPRVEVFGNREKPIIALALGVPTACVEAAAQSGVVALGERTRAYIKVQDGCDAHCTYCIIPSVRPNLACRPPELILQEARQLLARGYRELVLTGVRLGRYRWPDAAGGNSRNLVSLVDSLLGLPGDYRIRLSSLEVTEIPDALLTLMKENPRLCPHFHIPLQSGDNEILKRMGRWYTAGEYRDQVHAIKAVLPEAALSADVIAGFPGEGDRHFQNSARLLEGEGFSRLHVFRYSVRPGTPAERLKGHVDPRVKSLRARRLVDMGRALQTRFARRFLHRPVRVLAEAHGSGYTDHYVRVQIAPHPPEGTFQRLIPKGIQEDGTLVAEAGVQ